MNDRQIYAVCTAMKALFELQEDAVACRDLEHFKEYIKSIAKKLEKSEIDNKITICFEDLAESVMPIAEYWCKIHAERQRALEEEYERNLVYREEM